MDLSHLWTALLSGAAGAGGARLLPAITIRLNGHQNRQAHTCAVQEMVQERVLPVLEKLADATAQNSETLAKLATIAERQERREERREDLRAAMAEQRTAV
ncbi:MAG TPA: hypothetical protein VKZ53_18530 [Candidatus Angelobacter sp.]|nr:hypothetical protein [Candidatus Angelobacter sp.]